MEWSSLFGRLLDFHFKVTLGAKTVILVKKSLNNQILKVSDVWIVQEVVDGVWTDAHTHTHAHIGQIGPLENIVNYVLSTEDSELWYRGTMLRF